MAKIKFKNTYKAKLIYVFGISQETHKNALKVGEATFGYDGNILEVKDNSEILSKAAKNRINSYTQTAGIPYQLLYTTVAAYKKNGEIIGFRDYDVHEVLKRSGIDKKEFNLEKKPGEWFVADLETIKKAIQAVKEGKKSLNSNEISEDKTPIIFRPEQESAIKQTVKQFKKDSGKRMLWNAKMRFGKTLSALEVVKRMEFGKTLILTHRPVVDEGWFEDFGKIFYEDDTKYIYGSKNNGENFENLEKVYKEESKKYIYFASMQDLRGSEKVGGNFDKNDEIFSNDWDLIIVDEAHEGTQTKLGQNVLNELNKEKTKILELSGTPFNILSNYKENEIYTWDYVMEQKAKLEWDRKHPFEPNPYSSLPKLNIYTYDLGDVLTKHVDTDGAFNFKEFFRVNEEGKFIHEKDVKNFLDLISKEDSSTNYPYSTEEYRKNFRHSLWMVPGVKEAKVLSKMLKEHPIFQTFEIANVAGDGDEEQPYSDALKEVKRVIGKNPDQTYSITLSCGRLTTGVSVKEWTSILMLSGSYNTSASSYMQTIFRVQTPSTINGKVKEEACVFDFAPDRTLKVVSEVATYSAKARAGKKKIEIEEKKAIEEFLNFCPIIAKDGSKMEKYNVEKMMSQLKKAQIDRVIRNGFEDAKLYDNNKLMKLGVVDLEKFSKLKEIIGKTKSSKKVKEVDVNKQGFTDEEWERIKELKKKPEKELTKKEKAELEKNKEVEKNKKAAISILRGISIRMPLLIYGAEIENEKEELTLDNFVKLVDDDSWEEFMPRGVSKEKFEEFKEYYDEDIFREAGKRIRKTTKSADNFRIEERIDRITDLFSNFRNPDKETVLTPWKVVNMHLGDVFGGYRFFNQDWEKIINPEFIQKGDLTKEVFASDSNILDINSKTGLYPLYAAYSIYRQKVKEKYNKESQYLSLEEQQKVWNEVVKNNIFAITKTPMAKKITRRTLVGFQDVKTNIKVKDLVAIMDNSDEIKKLRKGKNYWKVDNKTNNMKFNAIVGNPPYQEMDGGAQSSAKPVYQNFVRIAKKLNPDYLSLIMPSRWFTGGKGLDDFRKEMLNDKRIVELYDYFNSADVFPNVDIKGGVSYFLWDNTDKKKDGLCKVISYQNGKVVSEAKRKLKIGDSDIFIRYNEAVSILDKVLSEGEKSFAEIISSQKPFGLRTYFKGSEKKFKGAVKIYANQSVGYIKENEILKNIEYKDKHKVIVPRAIGSGDSKKDIIKPIYSEPNSVCTETYIMIGPFRDKQESLSVMKYIKTKFFHFLVTLKKNTMMASKDVYKFVPMQDFSENLDIDWTKSILEIDQQLYKKYNLTPEEINFIESMVRPMANK